MRIFFTGGTGKAGRHAVPHLISRGHQVLNADRTPLDLAGVDNLGLDLTDAGQVWAALAGWPNADALRSGAPPGQYDAVVHFAAVPRVMLEPDNATYANNVLSTYNVLEAALGLGIRKIVFASSETTYGICFANGGMKPDYLPVDEEHPTVPHDSYAMSKICNEATARSFQARSGADIYGLRINNVIEPHEYTEQFPDYIRDPGLRERNIFAYIDARDLGHMVDRCLATDGLGYQVFNVANPDLSVAASTDEIARQFYPGVEMRRDMAPDETFYAIDKARRMVGFAPEPRWREALGQEPARL